ncbi:MAG: signal peptidase I [Patescibacteria group bacterium]|nr:signal peptidase I [Patescibacteria group bacterium]
MQNEGTPASAGKRNLFLTIFVGTVVFIYDVFKTVSTVLGVAFLIRFFLIQPFYVSGQSMEPNYHDNEYIIVDQISYRFKQPSRGDVIVFKYPLNKTQSFIKRIIALPGERITVYEGEVKIYNAENPAGFRLNENYLPPSLYTSGTVDTQLREDEFFAMGDNRPYSSDSRQWGILPRNLVVGRVWVILYPFERFQTIPTPSYNNSRITYNQPQNQLAGLPEVLGLSL